VTTGHPDQAPPGERRVNVVSGYMRGSDVLSPTVRRSVELSSVTEMWDRLTGTQPDPELPFVLATAVLALLVVLPYQVWRISRNVVTIAHEGGHALAALLTGRRLTGIRLHSDTSGVTVSVGKPSGPGMVFTGAAGYVAPSLLGLAFALILEGGRITALLWISIALLVGLLVMIRNVYGLLSVVVTGGIVFAVSWFATSTVQAVFAYAFTWFLLVAGVRPVFELQRKRRRRQARDSDADQLARLTPFPGIMWVGFFLVVTLACLMAGGSLLIPR